jgi:hypothetical protein
MPDATTTELSAIEKAQPLTQVNIAGGYNAISKNVEDQLASQCSITKVIRYNGQDRYDTSALIAAGDVDSISVASGSNDHMVDALVAGPVAARNGSCLLLNPNSGITAYAQNLMANARYASTTVNGSLASQGLYVFGGVIDATDLAKAFDTIAYKAQ